MPLPFVGGLLARFALTRVGGFIGRIPRWAWIALAVVVIVVAGNWYHGKKVDAQYKAAYAAGKADEAKRWQIAFDKMQDAADKWKANYEAKAEELSTERRKRHDETLRRNSAIADALRLRGPGAASASRCRPLNNSGLSNGPGQSGSSPSRPDAPGPSVPADGGDAIVPWSWLVKRAEEHDELLSEANTWRTWYPEQAELLRRKKLELPMPTFGQEN